MVHVAENEIKDWEHLKQTDERIREYDGKSSKILENKNKRLRTLKHKIMKY